MKYSTIKPWQKRAALFFGVRSNQTLVTLVIACWISVLSLSAGSGIKIYFENNLENPGVFVFAAWIVLGCTVSLSVLGYVKIFVWAENTVEKRILFESDIERARELALRYPEKYGSEILRRIKKAQEADDAIYLVPYLDCIERERRKDYGGSHSARCFGSYWV